MATGVVHSTCFEFFDQSSAQHGLRKDVLRRVRSDTNSYRSQLLISMYWPFAQFVGFRLS